MKPFLPGAKSEMPGWPGWHVACGQDQLGARILTNEGDLSVYRSILHEEDHSAILHVSAF